MILFGLTAEGWYYFSRATQKASSGALKSRGRELSFAGGGARLITRNSREVVFDGARRLDFIIFASIMAVSVIVYRFPIQNQRGRGKN